VSGRPLATVVTLPDPYQFIAWFLEESGLLSVALRCRTLIRDIADCSNLCQRCSRSPCSDDTLKSATTFPSPKPFHLTVYNNRISLHVKHSLQFMSFSSGHEVRSLNDLFRPHDYIRLLVPLMVVQVFLFFFFRKDDSRGVVFRPDNMI
jgi:hypothetical protein